MRLVALFLAPPVGLALAGFLIAPPRAEHPPFTPPGYGHPLGTDDAGYDVLALLARGGRTTLGVGLVAGTLATAAGVIIGASAGYWQRVDSPLMRLVDLVLAFPRLPLLILLSLFLRPTPLNAVAVLVLFGWAVVARTVRPAVAAVRAADYVLASRALGARDAYILGRHVLPQLTALLLTQLVLEIRFALVAESGLAFLGLTDPSVPSWGLMLAHAFNHPQTFTGPYWQWVALPPALSLVLVVLGLTLWMLGELQFADPRLTPRPRLAAGVQEARRAELGRPKARLTHVGAGHPSTK
jgi:peptide/nickel transport system permease protein